MAHGFHDDQGSCSRWSIRSGRTHGADPTVLTLPSQVIANSASEHSGQISP